MAWRVHEEARIQPSAVPFAQLPTSVLSLSFCADSGHALEAGWFLLQYSAEWGDKELQKTAINKFVQLPYQIGWDKEHSGFFYFLDVDGHCPTQVYCIRH